MKSRSTRKFWRLFEALPVTVQNQARQTYRQFQSNPAYPSLNFKRVDASEPVYSVRIGIYYRALGILEGDTITWFWIGPHDAYDKLL
jgi:hypothetical protein